VFKVAAILTLVKSEKLEVKRSKGQRANGKRALSTSSYVCNSLLEVRILGINGRLWKGR
jgi:hypothetical protein